MAETRASPSAVGSACDEASAVAICSTTSHIPPSGRGQGYSLEQVVEAIARIDVVHQVRQGKGVDMNRAAAVNATAEGCVLGAFATGGKAAQRLVELHDVPGQGDGSAAGE